jgi:Flp pilus assembly protein TadD
MAHNNLSWLLANSREAGRRDPALAIAHAQKAVELDPKNSIFHNTLGAAHYRSGDWQAAVTSLEESIKLSAGGSSENWLLLAMAHWQLGHKDEARTWFEKAASNKPERPDADLEQLHREAADLLGMPPL